MTATRLIPFALTLLLLGPVGHAAAGAKPAPDLRQAWSDLASEDDAKAARALLAFGKAPKEAAAFLKANLRPVKVDARLVAQWLKELDGEDAGLRAEAQLELAYLDKYIKTDLEKAVKGGLSPEAKRRVDQLLERIASAERQAKLGKEPPPAANPFGMGKSVSISNVNGQVRIVIDGKPLDLTPRVYVIIGPPRPWVRAVRAVALLEDLATPEARRLLEMLAQGEADALPTTEARAALARLKAK